ncbi:MAG TPA: efflux RND transporter periplasmic adaptor subunit [Pirellulales bacterium]|nr:efflux RND transporter periplasmic adaptor subunit [Pirellulales bacterium]
MRLLVLQLPNALVLCALVGLLFWGHVYHWHVPKFSEVMRQPVREPPQVDPDDTLPGAADLPVTEMGAQIPALQPVLFESAEAVRKSGIEIALVERRPMVEEVVALGTITYDQTLIAQLSARVAGTVWSVEKKVGEPIKKGEIMAIIEALDVGRAKSEFLQAVVAAELRQNTLLRMRKYQSAISDRDLREAETDAREARIKLFNAQQTLINLGLPVRLEDMDNLNDTELVERIHFLGLPKKLVERLDPQKTTANLVPLVAPFDGMVIGRDIVVGELVEPSTSGQFVIADVRRMWVELDVRKEDAPRIRRGQEVMFSADGLKEKVHGKLAWISTEVDKRTRMVQARIEVDNPLIHGEGSPPDGQRLLRANMFGSAHVRIQERTDAIVVPTLAIQRDGAVNVVFVRTDERVFQPRPVELGIVNGPYTEVLTGLRPGDEVAAGGSHVLKAEVVKQRLAGVGS